MKEIVESGTERGHVKSGATFIRLSDGKAVTLAQSFFGKFYRLSDDSGYKYIQNNDGSVVFKMHQSQFNLIEPELAMYEPPLIYTPAPVIKYRADYDKKLSILPEVTYLFGAVNGKYMSDLFNDTKASTGTASQFGLHFATRWKLPVTAGLVLHYEKASYGLTGGGSISYSSPSFGPQFKTTDFDLWGAPVRFQTQFRVSPLAQAQGKTASGDVNFKFNSADLLFGVEVPVKNFLGEFVVGAFYQNQWLNIRDQPEAVNLTATNEINSSFGLSLAQVFE